MTIKTRHLFTTALVAAPLLLALDLRGDALAFHPEAGSSVDKELVIAGAMYIDDVILNVTEPFRDSSQNGHEALKGQGVEAHCTAHC